MKIILIFTIATVINVILSTIRSLCTINGSKIVASLSNAICYGFYCYVVVLTVAEFPIWEKILITALANFIGVFIVKLIEEKARKDKLWKVEMTIKNKYADSVNEELAEADLPYGSIPIANKDWVVFNCYCKTQKDTTLATEICKRYKGKISAYESKSIQ